jgi:hypothetical protein
MISGMGILNFESMKKGILVAGMLVAVAACKKVVSVELRDAPSQLVIEGEVTNGGTPQVKISRSVPFSASNSYPPVSGAVVMVTDSNNGLVAVLKETEAGMYTTKMYSGVSGHAYRMSVTVGGQTYAARSVMPRQVSLDSVTFAMNTDINNHKDINAVVNFQDPPGEVNYYQFAESKGGRLIPDVFVFEDRLSDGRYIEQPLFNDSTYLQRGDQLMVTMNCVDRNVYQYFYSLSGVTGNNGFQTATPANPVSNISNGALGYFSAHTTQRVIVEVY